MKPNMKYDTTITHSMKPVENMPKKKNVSPNSLQQVRIPSDYAHFVGAIKKGGFSISPIGA